VASPVTGIGDAIMLCTHPTMYPIGPDRDRFDRLAAQVRMTRYGGDCVNYGLLALGTIDVIVEADLAPYDIIPLIPIVEAAGGVITDLHGEPPTEGGEIVAAATPELHVAALAIMAAPGRRSVSTCG
jgi:myo-inositol-1(or 4)-monophosphatase